MGDLIDDLAKALASGVSRREALAGLVAGTALALPWTSEAKKGGKKNKENKKKKKKNQSNEQSPSAQPPSAQPPAAQPPTELPFAKLQRLCDEWCEAMYFPNDPDFLTCIKEAESGAGECYDATLQGPGFYCLNKAGCTPEQTCCPGQQIEWGFGVTDATCCPPGKRCIAGISSATGLCV